MLTDTGRLKASTKASVLSASLKGKLERGQREAGGDEQVMYFERKQECKTEKGCGLGLGKMKPHIKNGILLVLFFFVPDVLFSTVVWCCCFKKYIYVF